jgi:hypothetical protein
MKDELASLECGSRSGGSTGGSDGVTGQPDMLKNLNVSDNNKCNKARAIEINYKLAKFFHNNAIPFNIVESDELSDLMLVLCPAYHQHGLQGRFWLSTTSVDLVYNGLREEVEGHLQRCDAVVANMDGWENEKKQQLKIVT